MTYVAASIVLVCSVIGVLLTLLTFPGIWFMLAVAVMCDLWRPELFSTRTLIIAAVLAAMAEVVEFVASAAGARRARGSRIAAVASIFGAVIGAIAGSFLIPIPIVGTILGGVIGAGLFAGLAELTVARQRLRHSVLVARGAATGRALSIVAKGGIGVIVAMLLSIAAFWP